MTEVEIKYSEIKILLSQILAIKNKSDSITKATGGNYNIFRVLGVGSEELVFSKMIAHLLKVNASHGMGTTFLKLFIEKLSNICEIPFNLKYEEATVHTEYDIGKRIDNGVKSSGGRLDIFIEIPSDEGPIGFIIENKIYAGDQNCQLRRYKNFADNKYQNKKYILYLTLNGYSPSTESTQIKKDEEQFWYEISYSYFIKEWIEDCIKESSNYPYLRESLNQFLNQIKRLTGQDYNKMAEKEIIDLLSNNLELVGDIYRNAEMAKYKCAIIKINNFLTTCQNEGFKTKSCQNKDVETKSDCFKLENLSEIAKIINPRGKYGPEFRFNIYKNDWHNFYIQFAFQDRDLKIFKYGIAINHEMQNGISKDLEKLAAKIKDDESDSNENWLYRVYPKDISHWDFKNLKNPEDKTIENKLKDYFGICLEKMKSIEDNYPEFL